MVKRIDNTKPIIKDDAVKVSRHVKLLIVEGSQLLKQTEKQFVDNAVISHFRKIESEQPIIKKLKEVGLI